MILTTQYGFNQYKVSLSVMISLTIFSLPNQYNTMDLNNSTKKSSLGKILQEKRPSLVVPTATIPTLASSTNPITTNTEPVYHLVMSYKSNPFGTQTNAADTSRATSFCVPTSTTKTSVSSTGPITTGYIYSNFILVDSHPFLLSAYIIADSHFVGATEEEEEEEKKKKKKKKKNRCATCNKKVGLTAISCRCGGLYCAIHRYSDRHDCTFDYRQLGAEQIRRNNPVVIGEKIRKI